MIDPELNQAIETIDAVTDSCLECSSTCCGGGCGHEVRCNLSSTNWLADVPGNNSSTDIVEVHFKNTRRGFYRNTSHLQLEQGDWVAVESMPGHDIGRVALTGRLVLEQMKRVGLRADAEILRVFRKARAGDLERYEQAKAREVDTMIRSRQIAADLGLKMKIGDVEYQGDGNKAIFYYIADERVDFRQLIKVLADVFKIRVEMKQIGARQEAGRIGGIGPCGRPLCCATWLTRFVSVTTGAARYQDISLNPQKLAGQCAKLKCCINFEVDTYAEASSQMPSRDVVLETEGASYYHFKTDLFKREITYSTDRHTPEGLVTVSVERVREVIELNAAGVRPAMLYADDHEIVVEQKAFGDILGQDSISRFDKKKKKRKKKASVAGDNESVTEPVKMVFTPSEKADTTTQGRVPTAQSGTLPQKEDSPKVENMHSQGDVRPRNEKRRQGDQRRPGDRRRDNHRGNRNAPRREANDQ